MLDVGNLDELCQERQLQRQQKFRNDVNSKLAEIARSCNPTSEEVTRPYGVEREGESYDVWHLILEHVTEPSEVTKLWEVCEMFRDILRGKYVETRMPEIVRLMLDIYSLSVYLLPDEPEEFEFDDYGDFEKWERNASMSIFTSVRLISKQCNRSWENLSKSENRDYLSVNPFVDVNTTAKVQMILEYLRANPSRVASFFSSYLSIIEDDEDEEVEEDLEQFRESILVFLKLVGHHIRFFTCYISLKESGEIYNCLRKWIEFLPNLESLSFQARRVDDHAAPPLEEIEPFPKLLQLRVLEGRSSISASYVQRILEACPSIVDVELREEEHESDESAHVFETLMKMTSLQICLWKLNRLVLTEPFGDEETHFRTIPSCRLFDFLKQFEETLEHFEMEYIFATDCSCFLELRNLKTLKIKVDESFQDLNFLLYAERLENLHLTIGKKFTDDEPPKERGDKGLMDNSRRRPFGKFLPNLNSITINSAICFLLGLRMTS